MSRALITATANTCCDSDAVPTGSGMSVLGSLGARHPLGRLTPRLAFARFVVAKLGATLTTSPAVLFRRRPLGIVSTSIACLRPSCSQTTVAAAEIAN
jgi:hypothetical protein